MALATGSRHDEICKRRYGGSSIRYEVGSAANLLASLWTSQSANLLASPVANLGTCLEHNSMTRSVRSQIRYRTEGVGCDVVLAAVLHQQRLFEHVGRQTDPVHREMVRLIRVLRRLPRSSL